MKKTAIVLVLAGAAAFAIPSTTYAGGGFRLSIGGSFALGGHGGHVSLGVHQGRHRGGQVRHGGHVPSRCWSAPRHKTRTVGHRPHVPHVHSRIPCYAKRWVPPVYRTVVVGYDFFGRPVTRSVCVQAGYYRSVVTGYRCGRCGCGL